VSSKIANAVERNRVKRWVREEFRAMQGDLPAVDFVVIARAGVLAAGRAAVRRALEAARTRVATGGSA
jgi:ribonuclease P protein component